MNDDDILEIQCPKCGNTHPYELEVHRSIVLENLSIYSSPGKQSYKQFTRLFTCPEKEENFQVTFAILEFSKSPIESVDVKGIVENGKEEE